ncbi:MAG: DUF1064 domain-containing protein [Bacteroidales bacterium]|nr:DUF1064 domain-containing protein [Candidatus Scybalousia scybalohippi]
MRSQNKYKARKIETSDGVFDSKKEYERWLTLKEMEKLDLIENLSRQVRYELIPGQRVNGKILERAVYYVADFEYIENGQKVVEDVKGYRDGAAYRIFVIKRKLMLYIHGIRVKEI